MLCKAPFKICGNSGIKVTLIAFNNVNKPTLVFHVIMITVMDKIRIPFSEFSFSFARSGGSGGQNVNKVNSKVVMDWNLEESPSVSEGIKERFKARFRGFLIEGGRVQIMSQLHRSQKANQDDCIEKLHTMLAEVQFPPKLRKKTRPKRSAVLKRLDSKRKDSDKKKLRKVDY
jgi:ribosome-associated protein